MASKLFRPWPLPALPDLREGPDRQQKVRGPHEQPHPLERGMLLGRKNERGFGHFIADFYDAGTRFSATSSSRRWRLQYDLDGAGRPIRDNFRPRARREPGFWADLPKGSRYTDAGEARSAQCMRVPFGPQAGPSRDLNVQFLQVADKGQTVTIPKPPQLITNQGILGEEVFSTIHSTIDTATAEGFMLSPPQSHFMDADPASVTFAKYIEPEGQSIITPSSTPGFWDASTTLRSRLKIGLSFLKLWCPTGEYCDFDTQDKEHYKITREDFFGAEEVSLPIKVGQDEATFWDVYLVPRNIQMEAEWWSYYVAITPFSYFAFGLHEIRNNIARLPNYPVPYGSIGGELDDISFTSDWVYYVAQWRGPFNPGIAQAHPRPVGFEDAGGETAFDPTKLTDGIWEGPPVRGSDYAIEYAIKHGVLASYNPHDFEIITPFFAILFDGMSPVSYFARITNPVAGDLVAKVITRGRSYEKKGDTFYIWQKKQVTTLPRTINWGFMVVDPQGDDDFWSLPSALSLGGWTP